MHMADRLKRGNGTGGYEYRQGRRKPHRFRFSYLDEDTGVVQTVEVGSFETKTEGERALAVLIAKHEAGELDQSSAKEWTVGSWCADWLERSRDSVRYRTWKGRESHVRTRIEPYIGRVPLADFARDLKYTDRWQARLLADGLKGQTVRRLRATLGKALRDAVRRNLIRQNPLRLVDPPKVTPRTPTWVPREHLKIALEAVAGDRHEALYWLVSTIGMRSGELRGLVPADFDLDAGTLHITHSIEKEDGVWRRVPLKTLKSQRILPLDPGVVDLLRKRIRLAEMEREVYGDAYNKLGLVFTRTNGDPLTDTNILQQWQRRLKAAGLPEYRFHDIRHGVLTVLLEEGYSLKEIQEWAGHGSITTTADIYSHVTPKMLTRMGGSLSAVLRGADDKGESPVRVVESSAA